MSWLWLFGVAALLWVAYTLMTWNANRRVVADIHVPEHGRPTISISPGRANPDDLSLTALCYLSKIRWLLDTEPQVVMDTFKEMCGEAVDFMLEPARGQDLIGRMPTADAFRSYSDDPKAVSGGESYRVRFYRTRYKALRNKAWVINSLPRPSLALNPPWSSIVLLNGAHALLADRDRRRLRAALAAWFDVAFGDETFRGLKGLNRLFEVSYATWETAPTESAI